MGASSVAHFHEGCSIAKYGRDESSPCRLIFRSAFASDSAINTVARGQLDIVMARLSHKLRDGTIAHANVWNVRGVIVIGCHGFEPSIGFLRVNIALPIVS